MKTIWIIEYDEYYYPEENEVYGYYSSKEIALKVWEQIPDERKAKTPFSYGYHLKEITLDDEMVYYG